jgi:hypothetical protein
LLQFQIHRFEPCGIVADKGEPTVSDSKIGMTPGDYVISPRRAAHHNRGDEMPVFNEVQFGDLPGESETTRLQDGYGWGLRVAAARPEGTL